MITLVFIESDGTEHAVQAFPGDSIMTAAVNHLVPGILAECGGACACATCHVRIFPEYAGMLPEMMDPERGLLTGAIDPDVNSRLACQISVTDEMNGLRIHIPDQQI